MSLHQFYHEVWAMTQSTGWRIGQTLYNHLCVVRIDLAIKINGTEIDPFYSSSPTDEKYIAAIQFIEQNWNITASNGN